MDKSTLSNYGWVVIAVLVLSVMIALATPFGDYIGNAVKSTTEGLFKVQQNALGAADMVISDQSFENNDGGSGGTNTEFITIYAWNTETGTRDAVVTIIEYEQGMTWEEWLNSKYNQPFVWDGSEDSFGKSNEEIWGNIVCRLNEADNIDDIGDAAMLTSSISASKFYYVDL